MAKKQLVPDELWEEIEPLLPPRPPPSPKGGRPPVDDRAALAGIVFVLHTGVPWQMLPTEAFGVSGSSCWRRLGEWAALGVWPEVHARLLERLGRLGGTDLQHAVIDSASVRAVKGGSTAGPTRSTVGRRGANATC
jgi:transposase